MNTTIVFRWPEANRTVKATSLRTVQLVLQLSGGDRRMCTQYVIQSLDGSSVEMLEPGVSYKLVLVPNKDSETITIDEPSIVQKSFWVEIKSKVINLVSTLFRF
jgi:hypothetical protein